LKFETLDVDGWTVTFGTAMRGLGGAVPNVTVKQIVVLLFNPLIATLKPQSNRPYQYDII